MRVPKGCAICGSDVLGTMRTGFYCQRCNVLFSKRQVRFHHLREDLRQRINHHFSGHRHVEPPKVAARSFAPEDELELPRLPDIRELAAQVSEVLHAKPILQRMAEERHAREEKRKSRVAGARKRKPKLEFLL